MRATGKSLTDWQKLDQQQKIRDINYFIIHLIPQRETLYKTIEIRFQEMLKAGAMDEVKMLMPLELNPLLPALKAVGVPELIVTTEKEYEDHALRLATNEFLLSSITKKIQDNKFSAPLFDSKKYTSHLERAFEQVLSNYIHNIYPRDIEI